MPFFFLWSLSSFCVEVNELFFFRLFLETLFFHNIKIRTFGHASVERDAVGKEGPRSSSRVPRTDSNRDLWSQFVDRWALVSSASSVSLSCLPIDFYSKLSDLSVTRNFLFRKVKGAESKRVWSTWWKHRRRCKFLVDLIVDEVERSWNLRKFRIQIGFIIINTWVWKPQKNYV